MITTTDHKHYPDADLQEAPKEPHGNARRYTFTRIRNDLHNLIAAARATLRAHADGEDDPLYYIRDELQAQGQLPSDMQHRVDYQERP